MRQSSPDTSSSSVDFLSLIFLIYFSNYVQSIKITQELGRLSVALLVISSHAARQPAQNNGRAICHDKFGHP
jgi:hypothetical protein